MLRFHSQYRTLVYSHPQKLSTYSPLLVLLFQEWSTSLRIGTNSPETVPFPRDPSPYYASSRVGHLNNWEQKMDDSRAWASMR